MLSLENKQHLSIKPFYKICIVGGGLTGAMMTLLLKNSKIFKHDEIAWIKPKTILNKDLRTTFYNQESLKLLDKCGILKKLNNKNYFQVKKIEVFGDSRANPLTWNYSNPSDSFGAVIKNDVILNFLNKKLQDIKQYESFVTNTSYDEFERTMYLENKQIIKTHLLLSADGKNSHLRKLLAINSIPKYTSHLAVSGFFQLSRNHNSTAIQAFTQLGPIGILPYENKKLVNFVLSIDKNRYKRIASKKTPELYICEKLNDFFSNINLELKPIKKINKIDNKLTSWSLDLNYVFNPTSYRSILIGDAAHSIHPLAGQGFNLAMRDCVTALNSIKNCLKNGGELGDPSILTNYKKNRLPNTVAMSAITDFLFYSFTSDSKRTRSLLTSGFELLDKTPLKNVFRDLASN